MFHVRCRALCLSIDAFSHSRVDGIFAAARGPYRIQHSGDKFKADRLQMIVVAKKLSHPDIKKG